jgi:peptidoglycan/xylan/chitin deacetylase (PgdA/CDA1 family)
MRAVAKRSALWTARAVGGFALARRVTAGSLRILGYHGFALADEHRFWPTMFMPREVFRKRLEYLHRARIPVLPLAEALQQLDAGTLPPQATAITIDDGFYSVARIAAEELARFEFPATVYLTTYYVRHQVPIFRLAVQYLFWKSPRTTVDLSGLDLDVRQVARREGRFPEDVVWHIIRRGEALRSESERVELGRHLACLLAVDYDALAASRILSLAAPDEVYRMRSHGIDFQLHTHRHRLPESAEAVSREIGDNRAALAALDVSQAEHLAYPSGIWSPVHWPALAAVGVKSATTCEPGLNDRHTPRLALRRFLDQPDMPQVVFEGLLSGLLEIRRHATRTPAEVPA